MGENFFLLSKLAPYMTPHLSQTVCPSSLPLSQFFFSLCSRQSLPLLADYTGDWSQFQRRRYCYIFPVRQWMWSGCKGLRGGGGWYTVQRMMGGGGGSRETLKIVNQSRKLKSRLIPGTKSGTEQPSCIGWRAGTTTEYTELQPVLSGVHSVMRVKFALAGEGGGCTPFAPADWADTLTLFHLQENMYSVCTTTLCLLGSQPHSGT